MGKIPIVPDEAELAFEDERQLALPLDERFRLAEQYSFDFEDELDKSRQSEATRILNS